MIISESSASPRTVPTLTENKQKQLIQMKIKLFTYLKLIV